MRRYFIRDLIYVLRSRVFKLKPKVKKKRRFRFIIFLACLVGMIWWSSSLFETKVKPIVLSMAESRAKVIALLAINEGVRDEIVKKIKYEDLITLQRDEQQRVTALRTNMVKMNEIQAETSWVIQHKIANIGNSDLKIPLGNIFNSSILAGWGPKITIRIIPFGSVQCRFVDEFMDAGINQTKHKINLEFKAKIIAIVPLSRISTEVVNSIPIAETIIVGNVPQTYLDTSDSSDAEQNRAQGLAENLATQ